MKISKQTFTSVPVVDMDLDLVHRLLIDHAMKSIPDSARTHCVVMPTYTGYRVVMLPPVIDGAETVIPAVEIATIPECPADDPADLPQFLQKVENDG